MAFDEAAPVLLDRCQIEIAEPAAEPDQVIVIQVLAAEQHDEMIEPGAVDRREGAVVDPAKIDAAYLGGQCRAGGDDLDAIGDFCGCAAGHAGPPGYETRRQLSVS